MALCSSSQAPKARQHCLARVLGCQAGNSRLARHHCHMAVLEAWNEVVTLVQLAVLPLYQRGSLEEMQAATLAPNPVVGLELQALQPLRSTRHSRLRPKCTQQCDARHRGGLLPQTMGWAAEYLWASLVVAAAVFSVRVAAQAISVAAATGVEAVITAVAITMAAVVTTPRATPPQLVQSLRA